jgi:hypothetical protein
MEFTEWNAAGAVNYVVGTVAEATAGCLLTWERMRTERGEDFGSALGEWLRKQEGGKWFWEGAGSEEEFDFVRRHVEGECRRLRHGTVLLMRSSV